MEDVYLKKFRGLVSEVVDFEDKFDKYKEALFDMSYVEKSYRIIRDATGLNDEEYKELLRKINPRHISNFRRRTKKHQHVKGFRHGYRLYDVVEGTPLQTLLYLQKTAPLDRALKMRRMFKYPGEVDIEDKKNVDVRKPFMNLVKGDLNPFEDFLIKVRVYLPWKIRKLGKKEMYNYEPTVGQEILLSSRNTLTELKDRIACHEDFQDVCPDISKHPLTVTHTRSGDVYKSSMFYIGNNFYINTTDEDVIDYSEVIKNWAKQKNIDVGHTLPMEEALVKNLKARLGYPYLYMHQGSCEHLLVITDARLVHPFDDLNQKRFPILISFKAVKGKNCQICSTEFAKYVVSESEQLIYDHAFLCPNCVISFHYSELRKIGNFTLRKYVDKIGVL